MGGSGSLGIGLIRGEVFAPVAVLAATPRMFIDRLKPEPLLHIAGRKDDLVPFDRPSEAVERLRSLNGCDQGNP